MKHQHQAHQHHPAQHRHLTPANFRPPLSLLAMSAWQRLALAAGFLALLWGVVAWALQELA